MAAPDDDDEMSTAELELYARKAIKRIVRDSQPEIVANSDGRDAAAYHAPAAAPAAAVDCTTPNGEVELSETLQREIDGGISASARSASSRSATETTVLVGPRAARVGGKPRLLWSAAAVGLVALAIGAAALARRSHSRATVPSNDTSAAPASALPPSPNGAASTTRLVPLPVAAPSAMLAEPAKSAPSVSAPPPPAPIETASRPPRKHTLQAVPAASTNNDYPRTF